MEELATLCLYTLFCCILCGEEKKPVSSEEPKVVVNPALTGEIKKLGAKAAV